MSWDQEDYDQLKAVVSRLNSISIGTSDIATASEKILPVLNIIANELCMIRTELEIIRMDGIRQE